MGQVAVIGAGAAGLAAAAELKRRGIPAVVLERTDNVGASWRTRYDSLRLNTPRFTSTLAGYRMPRRYGRWPTRDAVIEYLEEYVRRQRLDVRFGVEVQRVDRDGPGWSLQAAEGEMKASEVVVATGHDHDPVIPAWSGRDGFPGELLHSADYRRPEPFRGRDVLVVSVNNSGSEIAYELASNGAARVWTARRTPPNVFPREWPRGIPINVGACMLDLLPDAVADAATKSAQRTIYGDLSPYGLPPPPIGGQTRVKHHHKSALVDAGFVDALKRGQIEVVAALDRFDGPEAVLVDGRRLRPEVVIAATGYRQGLEPLVGHLGVLDRRGLPTTTGGGTHPAHPGLYFNGYHATISGQLRHARKHGRAIARAIARRRGRRLAL